MAAHRLADRLEGAAPPGLCGSAPHPGRPPRAILGQERLFTVVQDLCLTETAQLADVVLPAATWGEKTGTFTNAARTVHISDKAVDPPRDARPDLDIFLDYARRMDFRDKDDQPLMGWYGPQAAFAAWPGAGCRRRPAGADHPARGRRGRPGRGRGPGCGHSAKGIAHSHKAQISAPGGLRGPSTSHPGARHQGGQPQDATRSSGHACDGARGPLDAARTRRSSRPWSPGPARCARPSPRTAGHRPSRAPPGSGSGPSRSGEGDDAHGVERAVGGVGDVHAGGGAGAQVFPNRRVKRSPGSAAGMPGGPQMSSWLSMCSPSMRPIRSLVRAERASAWS